MKISMKKFITRASLQWIFVAASIILSSVGFALDEDEMGCVVGNCIDGRGTLVTEGDRGIERYSGNFTMGEYHGFGEVFYEDEGVHYKGKWMLGKKQGRGTLWDKENNVYIGQWKNNRRNGQGIQIFKIEDWEADAHSDTWLKDNAENYYGDFQNDVFYGQGTYRWEDGTRYVGAWVGSKKHGKGYFDYGNGERSNRTYEFDVKVFD